MRRGIKKRNVAKNNYRGAKLKLLEDSIPNLDDIQSKAIIVTVPGVQRIGGLSGSGKTIALALKAAYHHILHPDWKIAVAFHARSLKSQLKQPIN
jgi:superfamily I DNA and RNA helicase